MTFAINAIMSITPPRPTIMIALFVGNNLTVLLPICKAFRIMRQILLLQKSVAL